MDTKWWNQGDKLVVGELKMKRISGRVGQAL